MSGWLSQFMLGRPGSEYLFDANPDTIDITEQAVAARGKNLAGDLKKSVIKASAPSIRINSREMTPEQRDLFSSLARVSDTFLSFQSRDDWKVFDELVTIIDATHVKLANTSSTRLSKALVELGLASIITIVTPFAYSASGAYGSGAFGAGAFGGGAFDPGAVTYDDLTRIIEMTNPVDVDAALFVSYTYTGWLVDMRQCASRANGPYAGIFTFDTELLGA